jgi:hypothetical protein
VAVAVAVLDGVDVGGVPVKVAVFVGVAVFVAVAVPVGVDVLLGTGVDVRVAVPVLVGEFCGVEVAALATFVRYVPAAHP